MRIRVAAGVKPTEDEERVRRAVQALFPDVSLERTGDRLEGEGRDDRAFLKSLRDQKIRDTARMVLARASEEGRIRVLLSKQAAAAGRVNFAVARTALGPLEVELEPEDLDEWLDAIAPPPEEGDRTAARRLEIHTEEKELEENYADFTRPASEAWEEELDGSGGEGAEAGDEEGLPGDEARRADDETAGGRAGDEAGRVGAGAGATGGEEAPGGGIADDEAALDGERASAPDGADGENEPRRKGWPDSDRDEEE